MGAISDHNKIGITTTYRIKDEKINKKRQDTDNTLRSLNFYAEKKIDWKKIIKLIKELPWRNICKNGKAIEIIEYLLKKLNEICIEIVPKRNNEGKKERRKEGKKERRKEGRKERRKEEKKEKERRRKEEGKKKERRRKEEGKKERRKLGRKERRNKRKKEGKKEGRKERRKERWKERKKERKK